MAPAIIMGPGGHAELIFKRFLSSTASQSFSIFHDFCYC
jgi:hypothetical protein